MHQWFYTKQGIIGDEQLGPFAEAEFLKLLRDGSVGRPSLISNPTRTSGNWITVESHPKLLEIWQAGQVQRDDARAKQIARKQAVIEARREIREGEQRSQRERELAEISDCTNYPVLEKILSATSGLLTSGEYVVYIAVREMPLAVTPDAMMN